MAVAVAGFFRAQACLAPRRRQEVTGWLHHRAAQADTDVVSTKISSAEAIEVRRMR